MSFGFKKKLLPSNKKTGVKNGAKEKETETLVQETATVYSNPNCLESELKYNGDDNGNTGTLLNRILFMLSRLNLLFIFIYICLQRSI